MPPITLICFDLGGVLVRLVRDWQHALELANVSLPPTIPPPPPGNNTTPMPSPSKSAPSPNKSLSAVQQCFPSLPPKTYWKIFDAWLLGLYPGLPSLLTDLKRAHLTTAVLSNTNARHWRILNSPAYAPLQQIDHLHASHLMQCRKPEPQAYQHIQQVTGKLPDEILFFDDRHENIEAAHRAGWHTHLINPTTDGIPQIRSHLQSLHLL